MSACNMADHFSTVQYWVWDVWEEQLLRLSYCWVFSTNFLPRCCLILCVFIATLFVSLTSANKRRYQKAIGSAVWFYCIQRIGWMNPWMITLCLQSHWGIPSYGPGFIFNGFTALWKCLIPLEHLWSQQSMLPIRLFQFIESFNAGFPKFDRKLDCTSLLEIALFHFRGTHTHTILLHKKPH